MHPAKEGFSSLPFFDEFDLSTVDILLISQYVTHSTPWPCHHPLLSFGDHSRVMRLGHFVVLEAALAFMLPTIYR